MSAVLFLSLIHIFGQCSEYLYVAFGILVAHVQPELVELIWRSVARVEPDAVSYTHLDVYKRQVVFHLPSKLIGIGSTSVVY